MVRLPCYPSDLTDSQWAHIKLLLPSQDGRKPKHRRRNLLDAILYVGRASGAWRALPMDFPPWPTVYGYFARWQDAGVKAVHDALRDKLWVAEGRDAEPTAGVIDSRSVQARHRVDRCNTAPWDNGGGDRDGERSASRLPGRRARADR